MFRFEILSIITEQKNYICTNSVSKNCFYWRPITIALVISHPLTLELRREKIGPLLIQHLCYTYVVCSNLFKMQRRLCEYVMYIFIVQTHCTLIPYQLTRVKSLVILIYWDFPTIFGILSFKSNSKKYYAYFINVCRLRVRKNIHFVFFSKIYPWKT